MRRVEYFELVKVENKGAKKYEPKFKLEPKKAGEAIFHQFGVDCVEGENCTGNPSYGSYSTAIIELECGTVKNVPVEMIKFLPVPKTHNID